MLPRECDNDACDYEAHTNDQGVVRGRWVHVASCNPVIFQPDSDRIAPPEYYLGL